MYTIFRCILVFGSVDVGVDVDVHLHLLLHLRFWVLMYLLIIVAKTENKFKTTRYNTLFYDGEEYVMRQMYTDDAFKTYDIRDLLQLKKFIILLTTDLKVNLPLNNKGYTLDMTSISTIEKIEK